MQDRGVSLTLEAPLTRLIDGSGVKLGIRAGDILLATSQPTGLSARNIVIGRITALQQQDVTVIAEVDCGAKFIVHLTPGACQSLALQAGQPVWLVLKTYSCHVLQATVAAWRNRFPLSSRADGSFVHRSRSPVMTLTAALYAPFILEML